MVRSAFPPERMSSTTDPPLLYVPSIPLEPQAAPNVPMINAAVGTTSLRIMSNFMAASPLFSSYRFTGLFGSGAGFAGFFAGVVVAGLGAGFALVVVALAAGVCAAGAGAVGVAVVGCGGVVGLTGKPLRRFIACVPLAAGAPFGCAALLVAAAPVAGVAASALL